jgi:uncharacterized cupin superfamily protein
VGVTEREVWRRGEGNFDRAWTEAFLNGPEGAASIRRGADSIPPGKIPYPYHAHSAQWEFYYVLSGKGVVRHKDGETAIEPGDAFIFQPEEPHTFKNDGAEDLVMFLIADNPIGESAYYPDSKKWLVRSPERRLMRGEALDYYDGEE